MEGTLFFLHKFLHFLTREQRTKKQDANCSISTLLFIYFSNMRGPNKSFYWNKMLFCSESSSISNIRCCCCTSFQFSNNKKTPKTLWVLYIPWRNIYMPYATCMPTLCQFILLHHPQPIIVHFYTLIACENVSLLNPNLNTEFFIFFILTFFMRCILHMNALQELHKKINKNCKKIHKVSLVKRLKGQNIGWLSEQNNTRQDFDLTTAQKIRSDHHTTALHIHHEKKMLKSLTVQSNIQKLHLTMHIASLTFVYLIHNKSVVVVHTYFL